MCADRRQAITSPWRRGASKDLGTNAVDTDAFAASLFRGATCAGSLTPRALVVGLRPASVAPAPGCGFNVHEPPRRRRIDRTAADVAGLVGACTIASHDLREVGAAAGSPARKVREAGRRPLSAPKA